MNKMTKEFDDECPYCTIPAFVEVLCIHKIEMMKKEDEGNEDV
tara:strand:- start:325 stop:453 length:129 start_codon:yes stop_codon:yes gene_type:complete